MRTYIPENIGYLVKMTGFTQDEFGAIFGLNKSLINHYISGKGNPKITTVLKICSHFEIRLDDFFYKSLEQPSSSGISSISDCDLLLKQREQIDSLQEEVERLNKIIIKLREPK